MNVSDEEGNIFRFKMSHPGIYRSDSLKFTGRIGGIYTLHIETSDGQMYVSDSQELKPVYSPESVYAEVDLQESMDRFNQVYTTVRGLNIIADIKDQTDTLPDFRFTSGIVYGYFYARNIPPPNFDPPLYLFYCWQTEIGNNEINLATTVKSENLLSINGHKLCFISERTVIDGRVYDLDQQLPGLPYKAIPTPNRQIFDVSFRTLYLDQYSLQRDTYLFYDMADKQLRSDGRIFDPIAAQLVSNIKCITYPEMRVFGFFEASSVSRTAYRIGRRNSGTNRYQLTVVPYNLPFAKNGCMINSEPQFWIR